MLLKSGIGAVLTVAFVATTAQAQIAPEQFRNKTFRYGWTEQVNARFDDGTPDAHFIINRGFTLYISSAGRSFGKQEVSSRNTNMQIHGAGRRGQGRRGTVGEVESAPGVSQATHRGLDTSMTVRKREYIGSKIRVLTMFSGSARLLEIDMTSGGCSINAQYGREGQGPMRRHNMRGDKTYTILSQSISSQHCTLKEGNAL